MEREEKCILCGGAFPAGLHIMGCLICFPCERRLLRGKGTPGRGGLLKLYGE